MPGIRYETRRQARRACAETLASVAQKAYSEPTTREAMRAFAHYFYLVVKPSQLEEIVEKYPVLLPSDDVPLTTWIDEFLFPEEAQIGLFGEPNLEAKSA